MWAKKTDHYFIHRDHAKIPVYSRGLVVDYARVDLEDLPRALEYRWHLHRDGYARRRERRSERPEGPLAGVYLHRFVLDLGRDDKQVVDHVHGDTLDCRKGRLEEVKHGENAFAYVQAKRAAIWGVEPLTV
jgi:hypothetical protein